MSFINFKFWKTQVLSRSGRSKAYTVSALTLHGFVERIFRIEKETCAHFFSYLTKTLRQLLRLRYYGRGVQDLTRLHYCTLRRQRGPAVIHRQALVIFDLDLYRLPSSARK